MKKTLRVNISGTIFNIDEDAYYKLKDYLDVIESRYSNSPEGLEIFSDIESRIAELLSEKISNLKTVINLNDVEEVINTMGMPDNFENEEDSHEKKTSYFSGSATNKRRMYRDEDEKYIAGVASGISHYFGINVLIIRALFIISLFFAGTGLIIYLILWIALPLAVTPSQKLEMKGEPITISNIESSINEEFRNVKENFERFKDSGKLDDLKTNLNRFISGIGSVFVTIIKVALILFGVILVISAISAIFGLTGGLFFADTIVSISSEGMRTLNHRELINIVDDSSNKYFIYIGLILTTVLPLILILFFGLKLIFKFRSNNKIILLSALGLWLVGTFMLAGSAFSISNYFKQRAEIKEKAKLEYSKNNTLLITLKDTDLENVDDILVNIDGVIVYENKKQKTVLLQPFFEIVPTSDNQISVELTKQARGISKKNAFQNASSINFNWNLSDTVLTFDKFFNFSAKNKWRNQELKIIIKIPIGKKVFISESLNNMHISVKNTEYYWDYEVIDRELIMTEEGLSIGSQFPNSKNDRDTTFTKQEVTDDMLNDLEKELKQK